LGVIAKNHPAVSVLRQQLLAVILDALCMVGREAVGPHHDRLRYVFALVNETKSNEKSW
jgi:hypothetical protein